ncbi:hypothetical protein [Mycobacterium sp. SMC-8]|uniref:hypothetical protein n=1 Tax=Mycobacterium sp. SMC-8 TaxID=2857060 RepID=UPI0021B37F79|nr:hypothetical protein [Mycobacterium sp. SMC-8]
MGGSIWAVIPGQGRWWLATVYIGVLATILVMRGRAFASREQSIIVVATGLLMFAYLGRELRSRRRERIHLSTIAAAVVLGLGAASLVTQRWCPEGVLTGLSQGHRMDRVPADCGHPPDGDLASEPDLPGEEHVMIGQRAGVLATVAMLAAAWPLVGAPSAQQPSRRRLLIRSRFGRHATTRRAHEAQVRLHRHRADRRYATRRRYPAPQAFMNLPACGNPQAGGARSIE